MVLQEESNQGAFVLIVIQESFKHRLTVVVLEIDVGTVSDKELDDIAGASAINYCVVEQRATFCVGLVCS